MKDFYCNKCEQEVKLDNGKCPLCKTNWSEILNNEIHEGETTIEEEFNAEADITETMEFYMHAAKIGKDVFIILAILIFIISMIYAALVIYEGMYQFIFMIIAVIISGVMIFNGLMFEKNMKWKAYMLQTNFKISKMLKK